MLAVIRVINNKASKSLDVSLSVKSRTVNVKSEFRFYSYGAKCKLIKFVQGCLSPCVTFLILLYCSRHTDRGLFNLLLQFYPVHERCHRLLSVFRDSIRKETPCAKVQIKVLEATVCLSLYQAAEL